MRVGKPRTIQGLKVRQWLPEWDHLDFDEAAYRRRPKPHFYLLSMSASELKALTGIQRRSTGGRATGNLDSGIQRSHQQSRSAEISRFIRYGFPWSALSEAQRRSLRYEDLRKPGWLPTSIVVNILDSNASGSRNVDVDEDDFLSVMETGQETVSLQLPPSFSGSDWRPKRQYPIEVIDGQHRLWAFENNGQSPDYQLPVVAFHGLDLSWQAYLFYTINIKPERINASLAFDLYPLLRSEDWLERFEGPAVYRETRSQELTQALWAMPSSPWYQHINMLGERGMKRMVRQAAWIRSLMATYVKSARGTRIGGLFGGEQGKDIFPWNGAQQAAFLIFMGQKMRDAVAECDYDWAEILREEADYNDLEEDSAFYGTNSLWNTDQGVRGLLFVTNDLCYLMAEELELHEWLSPTSSGANDQYAVYHELEVLHSHPVASFLEELSFELAKFDWRTSAASGLSEEERVLKATYRGGTGYRELRRQLLRKLSEGSSTVAELADDVHALLGYE